MKKAVVVSLQNTITIVFEWGAGKNEENFRIIYIRNYSTLLAAMRYQKKKSYAKS